MVAGELAGLLLVVCDLGPRVQVGVPSFGLTYKFQC